VAHGGRDGRRRRLYGHHDSLRLHPRRRKEGGLQHWGEGAHGGSLEGVAQRRRRRNCLKCIKAARGRRGAAARQRARTGRAGAPPSRPGASAWALPSSSSSTLPCPLPSPLLSSLPPSPPCRSCPPAPGCCAAACACAAL